jgi:hypothetical protein
MVVAAASSDGESETVLVGGVANQGAVVRVGDTVRRPIRPASPAIRKLLTHLEAVGFSEAPRFLGVDDAGREVFSYIAGEVGVPPFGGWIAGDEALLETARLLSRYHDAVASFDLSSIEGWSDDLADPVGRDVICHNDVCVENVVFRDGRAVGLLDFDFAAPGRPIWDAAMTARMWGPLAHPGYRRAWPGGLDAVARFGRFANAYGIAADQAVEFVDAALATHDVGRAFVRRHVDAGDPAFVEMWRNFGGPERDRLDGSWLKEVRDDLIRATAR